MQKRDPTTNQLFAQQAISADAPAAKKQVASILAKARAVGCARNGVVGFVFLNVVLKVHAY